MEWGRSSHFSLLLQIQSPKAHPLLLKKPCCSPTPCLVDPTDVPLLTDHSLHYPRPQLQQDSLGTHRLLWPGKQISYLQILITPSTPPRSIHESAASHTYAVASPQSQHQEELSRFRWSIVLSYLL